jgi:hypothetical protein
MAGVKGTSDAALPPRRMRVGGIVYTHRLLHEVTPHPQLCRTLSPRRGPLSTALRCSDERCSITKTRRRGSVGLPLSEHASVN